ncbi:MAG: phospho-N-acetylmuramoyl-pentapeptide-transferase [Planctomycetes bacterium]|nr:phospho-N-acetylmuramoyl-pentapeptide-transferase [Planctomycetota bacterium]
MLYHFLFRLANVLSPRNVFRYVTFRAAGAAATAFVVAILFGRPFIGWLRAQGLGENTDKKASDRLTRLHAAKLRTPTMGGVILLVAVGAATLLWARLDNPFTLLALYTILASGLIGFLDDRVKLRRRRRGISVREKFGLLALVGAIVAALLWWSTGGIEPDRGTLVFPFIKDLSVALGVFYLPFAGLVLVGTANAVNLTDGLDGMAAGCVVLVAGTFAVLAYVTGRADYSAYLLIPFVPGGEELAVFAAALAGAGLGFLWFNCHPAEVFMGDTGSLALGGSIGFLAVALRQEVLLLLVGGVFVAEAASVILQVASFRLRGRRVFRCAPLHHHFEFKGWLESKITTRFWIVGAILAVVGLASLKVR